jgi:hypothetical protein
MLFPRFCAYESWPRKSASPRVASSARRAGKPPKSPRAPRTAERGLTDFEVALHAGSGMTGDGAQVLIRTRCLEGDGQGGALARR